MRRKRTREDNHTYLEARIASFEAAVSASINPAAFEPQHAWNLDDRDPVHQFATTVSVSAIGIYPEKRAGDTYEITFYGGDGPSHRLNATLKDIQVRNEQGTLQYRQYRGETIPIYMPPKGLGLLEKVRGEQRWRGCLSVAPQFASDILALLGHERSVYLSIHERKDGRIRYIQNIALQTTDPEAQG